MIEVLFGESEAGAMKVAKNRVIIGRTDGPISVWAAGKKREPERGDFHWIEGTADEVVCLAFLLDIGDIRKPADSDYRRELIYSLYAQEAWRMDDEIDAELRKAGAFYGKELHRLKQFLEDGEPVRVWYSGAPYSLCGFYHLCSVLKDYENEVRTVRLPEYIQKTPGRDGAASKRIILCHNWGEVAAEEFASFLPGEGRLAGEEIRMYAGLWSGLKEDNSPLRAVLNGRVTGVPETFYDFLIFKRLTGEPVKEARLIGDILGSNPIGVGDWWYAKRIEAFIRDGRIKVTEDSENRYARVICLEKQEKM